MYVCKPDELLCFNNSFMPTNMLFLSLFISISCYLQLDS